MSREVFTRKIYVNICRKPESLIGYFYWILTYYTITFREKVLVSLFRNSFTVILIMD